MIDMNNEKLKTLKPVRNFITGTEGVEFCLQPDKGKRYPRSLVMTLLEKLLTIPKYGKFLKDAPKPEILLNKEEVFRQ